MDKIHSFNYILKSVVLRTKIFQYITDIHDQLAKNRSERYDWYDLGCFPDQLIKFNYIQRYKEIFNTIIRDNSCNTLANLTISKFRELYLESFSFALDIGNIEAIEFLNQTLPNEIDYSRLVRREHYQSNLALIEFLHQNVESWFEKLGTKVMDDAAFGSLEVIKFLNFNRTEGCSTQAITNAATKGNLEIIKFIRDNQPTVQVFTNKIAVRFAAKNGHLEVLKFLIENESSAVDFSISDILEIVKGGHLPIIKYLLEIDYYFEIANIEIKWAVNNGHFEMLQYFFENNIISQENINDQQYTILIDNAAINGNLEMLRYLHSNRSSIESCSPNTLYSTATRGHLEEVKFLLDNYGLRTSNFMYMDYILHDVRSHFEVFRYIYENRRDLLLPSNVMDYYAGYKDTTALQWLKDNTSLRCSERAYDNVVKSGNLQTLQWIRENTTLPFPTDLLGRFITYERAMPILQYLKDNDALNASNSPSAMDRSDNLEVTSFLHYNSGKCSSDAMFRAISIENIQMIKFLDQHRTEHINYSYTKLKSKKSFNFLERLKLIKHKKI
ncbi:hypothetical protein PPL_10843 [Heterostelium album PN500]|uniref:Ankyrin repeat protein n=1 Tax=Heterostelium pallidum (strain ATCC 26659 / Pp 5 / PN500) TaxID=670386 RepID=D3BS51_HETP5|nr:hypothetical protein PPL_10843 [Heterostelium album PN500]EFA75788.1 hypothetical protein PPL_10843 [Heterostelium album PN500]|eukprot:XP_020427922.1 hypothetical protein PPL_10843 [Heterostelium album PN500]